MGAEVSSSVSTSTSEEVLIKSIAFRSTLDYLREKGGNEAVVASIAGLPEEAQREISRPLLATRFLPFPWLVEVMQGGARLRARCSLLSAATGRRRRSSRLARLISSNQVFTTTSRGQTYSGPVGAATTVNLDRVFCRGYITQGSKYHNIVQLAFRRK